MIVRKHLILAVVILIAGLCLSCGEDKGTGPDGGSLFKVELERYFSSHDDDTSQVPIQRVPCSNASNDSSAYGLDVSGEWIMVALDIPETGKYKPHMNYASSPGSLISLKLEMSGCGTSTTSNFLLTEGSGIGWTPHYYDAAGSSTLSLTAGECTLKLTLLSGEPANLDVISFWPD